MTTDHRPTVASRMAVSVFAMRLNLSSHAVVALSRAVKPLRLTAASATAATAAAVLFVYACSMRLSPPALCRY